MEIHHHHHELEEIIRIIKHAAWADGPHGPLQIDASARKAEISQPFWLKIHSVFHGCDADACMFCS